MLSCAAFRRRCFTVPHKVASGAPVASCSARFNGTSAPPPPPSQDASASKVAYDRAEDLKREEQARADLFKKGFPGPFKMFREMQKQQLERMQQQQGGAAAAGGGGAMPGMRSPSGIIAEAWQEALKETSKRFMSSDPNQPPPQDFKSWATRAMGEAQHVRNRMVGQAAPAASSAAGSTGADNTTTTTSAAQSTTTGDANPSTTTTATPNAGGTPSSPFGGAQAAAGPQPRVGRILAGIIIMWCSFWMMRRQGIFGDFSRVQIPYWCVGTEDTAKWLLFIFNLDEARRLEIQQQFIVQRQSQPGLNFFDFVDAIQADWRSTPNYSREQVLSSVCSLIRNDGPAFRSFATIKGGLESGSGMFSGFFGGDSAGLTPYQKRIDSLMRVLPPSDPMGIAPMYGGATAAGGPLAQRQPWPAAGVMFAPVNNNGIMGTPMQLPNAYSSNPQQPMAYGGYQQPQGAFGGQPQVAYPGQQWPPAQHGGGMTFAPPQQGSQQPYWMQQQQPVTSQWQQQQQQPVTPQWQQQQPGLPQWQPQQQQQWPPLSQATLPPHATTVPVSFAPPTAAVEAAPSSVFAVPPAPVPPQTNEQSEAIQEIRDVAETLSAVAPSFSAGTGDVLSNPPTAKSNAPVMSD